MKRFIGLLLCLCCCLGVAAVGTHAAQLPSLDSLENIGELIGDWWNDLEVKDKLEEFDTEGLRDELGNLLKESAALSDEALAERIRETAAAHGVTLDDTQVENLIKLLRTFEKGAEVKEKTEEAKEKAGKFVGTLRNIALKAGNFFRKFGDFLQKFGNSGT